MLELGEDECGADYLGGSPGAGGDALEGGPALGEQGESSFAQAAQGAEERVAGAGIDVQLAPVGGLPDRDVGADARTVISGSARADSPVGPRVCLDVPV